MAPFWASIAHGDGRSEASIGTFAPAVQFLGGYRMPTIFFFMPNTLCGSRLVSYRLRVTKRVMLPR